VHGLTVKGYGNRIRTHNPEVSGSHPFFANTWAAYPQTHRLRKWRMRKTARQTMARSPSQRVWPTLSDIGENSSRGPHKAAV
jgi:hypothetical protein